MDLLFHFQVADTTSDIQSTLSTNICDNTLDINASELEQELDDLLSDDKEDKQEKNKNNKPVLVIQNELDDLNFGMFREDVLIACNPLYTDYVNVYTIAFYS